MCQGFPIQGNSPFSIAFFDNGNNTGFYLFAGSDGNHVLKMSAAIKCMSD